MDEPLVTIIIRSYNEGWALKETLAALHVQNYSNWELIVIDSGSTDGSVELIKAFFPYQFIQISSSDYHPSRVMNCGMRLSRSEYAIFLNADATPQDSNWLRPLVKSLLNPNNAAVFGKQIPRPNCEAVYACDYERCFGENREAAKWDHFFSMVSSGIRKDVWSLRGFSEEVRYSEDDEYTRWCRRNGWNIVYCPESVVMHSHNYTPKQAFKRNRGEGEALAVICKDNSSNYNWLKFVGLGYLRDAVRDFEFCLKRGCLHEWPHALKIRAIQRYGKYHGFHQKKSSLTSV
jgi:rhamnosyltransferase